MAATPVTGTDSTDVDHTESEEAGDSLSEGDEHDSYRSYRYVPPIMRLNLKLWSIGYVFEGP